MESHVGSNILGGNAAGQVQQVVQNLANHGTQYGITNSNIE